MCVIMYQTKNQPTIDRETMKHMFDHNPDGGGIMWTDGKTAQYIKGFFNFDEMYNKYVELKNKKNTLEIACHMRIATGSVVDATMCHPFPITSNKSRLKRSSGHADTLIMHNGILFKSTKELSDTALYVLNNLKTRWDADRRWYIDFTPTQLKLFENEITGNRLCVMSADGTRLFGHWSDYKGLCKVSNLNWDYEPKWSQYEPYFNDYEIGYYESKRFSTPKGKKHKSYIDYLMEACQ